MAGTVFLHSAYPQGQVRTGIKSLSISNHGIVTNTSGLARGLFFSVRTMFGMRMYGLKVNTFIILEKFPILEVDSGKPVSGLTMTFGALMCSKFSF